MPGLKQPLIQLSQGLWESIFEANLFFVLSIIFGIILIYFLFRDIKINRKRANP